MPPFFRNLSHVGSFHSSTPTHVSSKECLPISPPPLHSIHLMVSPLKTELSVFFVFNTPTFWPLLFYIPPLTTSVLPPGCPFCDLPFAKGWLGCYCFHPFWSLCPLFPVSCWFLGSSLYLLFLVPTLKLMLSFRLIPSCTSVVLSLFFLLKSNPARCLHNLSATAFKATLTNSLGSLFQCWTTYMINRSSETWVAVASLQTVSM